MLKTLRNIIGVIVLAVCVPLIYLGLSQAEKDTRLTHPSSRFPVTQITHNQMTRESELRVVIENLQSESPDYSNMEPILRIMLQEQKASTEEFLKNLGPIENIQFKENDSGVDVYIIGFRNGRTIWEFGKSARGRIQVLAWTYLYKRPVRGKNFI
jgi:hypothetical protein